MVKFADIRNGYSHRKASDPDSHRDFTSRYLTRSHNVKTELLLPRDAAICLSPARWIRPCIRLLAASISLAQSAWCLQGLRRAPAFRPLSHGATFRAAARRCRGNLFDAQQ